GRYRKGALGRADDAVRSDGLHVLEFRQAEARAREWAARQHRRAAGLELEARGPYSVADAMNDYMAAYALRGGKAARRIWDTLHPHIHPELAGITLDPLTRQRGEQWRDAIASSFPRLRTSRKTGAQQRVRPIDGTNAEVMRARRASANRILTIFKAGLN